MGKGRPKTPRGIVKHYLQDVRRKLNSSWNMWALHIYRDNLPENDPVRWRALAETACYTKNQLAQLEAYARTMADLSKGTDI